MSIHPMQGSYEWLVFVKNQKNVFENRIALSRHDLVAVVCISKLSATHPHKHKHKYTSIPSNQSETLNFHLRRTNITISFNTHSLPFSNTRKEIYSLISVGKCKRKEKQKKNKYFFSNFKFNRNQSGSTGRFHAFFVVKTGTEASK